MADLRCCAWLRTQTGTVPPELSEPVHVRCDSRMVEPGDWLLIADRVERSLAQDYADEALNAGATAVLCRHDIVGHRCILLPCVDEIVSELARLRYAKLLQTCRWIGVTGTNGKTTTAWVAHHACAESSAYVGTLGFYVEQKKVRDLPNTTPEFLSIAADLEGRDLHAVFVEVSSIGIEQGRMQPVDWNVKVLTTLGRDHLDYHGTLDVYYDTKIRWFLHGDSIRIAGRTCRDIPGHALAASDTRIFWYEGVANERFPAIMQANIEAAVLAIRHAGLTDTGRRSLPPGRLEKMQLPEGATCYIDYAHTPDALEAVLSSLQQEGRLICVFGAGGDRDRGKRPEMAHAVLAGSEVTVFTSDNPRSEDPEQIIDDLVQVTRAGVVPSNAARGSSWYRITDRDKGIRFACRMAQQGDVVLIAGKGDENYTETATGRIPWSDREVVQGLGGESWRG